MKVINTRLERLERLFPRSAPCRLDAVRVCDALAELLPGPRPDVHSASLLIALGDRISTETATDADRALLAAIPADALGGVDAAALVAHLARRSQGLPR